MITIILFFMASSFAKLTESPSKRSSAQLLGLSKEKAKSINYIHNNL